MVDKYLQLLLSLLYHSCIFMHRCVGSNELGLSGCVMQVVKATALDNMVNGMCEIRDKAEWVRVCCRYMYVEASTRLLAGALAERCPVNAC